MASGNEIQGLRYELGNAVYDELVRSATTGENPTEKTAISIMEAEFALWEKSRYFAKLQQRAEEGLITPAEAYGQGIVPFPEEALKEDAVRQALFFNNPENLVYTFRSSGTTDPKIRGVSVLDNIGAALNSTAVISSWNRVLKESGHLDFIAGNMFPSFGDAIQMYNEPNQPMILPEASEKPFAMAISLFPDPMQPEKFAIPVQSMFIAYGAKLIGEHSSDATYFPVVPSDKAPFEPDMKALYELLKEPTNKPKLIMMATPAHPRIYQAMEQGMLPELGSKDIIWSGGGDKRSKSFQPTGLEKRLGFAVNVLGSSHEGGPFWGQILTPDDLGTDQWNYFQDSPLITNKAYSSTEGILRDHSPGSRLVIDLVSGVSRPGVIVYAGDRVRTSGEGIHFIGRESAPQGN